MSRGPCITQNAKFNCHEKYEPQNREINVTQKISCNKVTFFRYHNQGRSQDFSRGTHHLYFSFNFFIYHNLVNVIFLLSQVRMCVPVATPLITVVERGFRIL